MLGFTSTTLRPLSASDVILLAEKSGAECIEWGGDVHIKTPKQAAEVKKVCDDKGIKIVSYGSYYRIGSNASENWIGICETASAMEAKTIRVWLGNRGSRFTSDKQFDNLVSDALKMSEVAKAYNLTIASECHAHTYNDNGDASLKFLNTVNKPNVRTYFQARYKDLNKDLQRLEKTLDYVDNVHISFFDADKKRPFKKDSGIVVDKIVGELKRLNYQGNILLEFVKNSQSSEFCRILSI
jgi:sugar phosphate isomerase/epimerase